MVGLDASIYASIYATDDATVDASANDAAIHATSNAASHAANNTAANASKLLTVTSSQTDRSAAALRTQYRFGLNEHEFRSLVPWPIWC